MAFVPGSIARTVPASSPGRESSAAAGPSARSWVAALEEDVAGAERPRVQNSQMPPSSRARRSDRRSPATVSATTAARRPGPAVGRTTRQDAVGVAPEHPTRRCSSTSTKGCSSAKPWTELVGPFSIAPVARRELVRPRCLAGRPERGPDPGGGVRDRVSPPTAAPGFAGTSVLRSVVAASSQFAVASTNVPSGTGAVGSGSGRSGRRRSRTEDGDDDRCARPRASPRSRAGRRRLLGGRR